MVAICERTNPFTPYIIYTHIHIYIQVSSWRSEEEGEREGCVSALVYKSISRPQCLVPYRIVSYILYIHTHTPTDILYICKIYIILIDSTKGCFC